MDKTDKIPVFAIILPVYNEENNIRQCLDSIVRQTFEDWVCYICNDCSTDNSVSICAEYAQQDSRFVIINSKFYHNLILLPNEMVFVSYNQIDQYIFYFLLVLVLLIHNY